MTWASVNWVHIVGVALAVLIFVLGGIAGDPTQFGITWPYIGAWLGLVVGAIGLILKEMPSATQQQVINQQQDQIKALGGKPRGASKPKTPAEKAA
jgi:hypothetical protein